MNKSELIKEIKQLGLASGHVVMLHASLGSIGDVDGGAKTLVEAFLGVLGPVGTLVAPTFATSSEVFNPDQDPTGLGAVAEAVRRHPRALRSRHPLASIAAIGEKAEELVKDHEKARTAHGEGTPYVRLAQMGGYVLMLGVDLDRCTLMHTPETLCRLPYLATRRTGYLDKNGREQTATYSYFPGPHRNFIGVDRHLREKGIIKLGRIGRAVVRVIKAQDLIDEVLSMLKRNPAAVLCDNPLCEDCVTQRAAINQWRTEREAFRIVAASHFAGSTVEEIIQNLKAAGITELEITSIGGKDIALFEPEEWTAIHEQFAASDISVATVASSLWQNAIDRVLYACRSLSARQLVLPLLSGLQSEVLEAIAQDLTVLLRNGAVTGERAGQILAEYPEGVLVSFDPLGFLLAGEYPFRKSIKMPGRFRIGEVCLCDGTPGGEAVPLLNGNAEIKEIVSSLRCRFYSGDMLLTWPPHQPPPDFRRHVRDFFNMLEGL